MSNLYVCCLAEMPRHVASLGASHVISILTANYMPETPAGIGPDNHLKVACHDIVEPFPDAILPGESHVERIVEFAGTWDRRAPMVVHCFAGISRSTATALIVGTAVQPGQELELAQRLRAAAPHAHPNRLLVSLGDRHLGCNGALIDAVESIGYGTMLDRGPLTELRLADVS